MVLPAILADPKKLLIILEKFNLSELEKIIINHGNDFSRRAMADELSGEVMELKCCFTQYSRYN
jgi:hypothetical protein